MDADIITGTQREGAGGLTVEAHPRTLKFVFRSDVRLTVPLFQRPYVWTADEQWLPLWEDILATRARVGHGDTTAHFLGAVVLEQKRGSLGSLETREVIDGQQRLTTLQLVTAALRDAFPSRGIDDKHYRRINKLLVNDSDLVDEPDELHKLWPTNRDRNDYRNVMSGQYRTADSTRSASRIVDCYLWFRDALADVLEDMDEDESGSLLIELSEVLLEYVELVVIDLGESDNAQVIFETLNARGTALRASDLIKNLLFRTLETDNYPVNDLYAQYWEPLEAPSWQSRTSVKAASPARVSTPSWATS